MSDAMSEERVEYAPPAQSKRFTGIPTTRVQAGDGFDEWFDLAESTSTEDMMHARRRASAYKRANPDADDDEVREVLGGELFARMIKDWSFCDASGAKLPITRATVMGLPAKVILPAFKLYQQRQAESESFLDPSATTN
jgi:hypothetical protein